MPFMKMRSIARLDFIDSIIGNNFTLDTGWRTSQPWTFQPQTSSPDLSTIGVSTMNYSTPDFSTMIFWTMGLKSSWLKSLALKRPGLNLGVEKSRVEMSFNISEHGHIIDGSNRIKTYKSFDRKNAISKKVWPYWKIDVVSYLSHYLRRWSNSFQDPSQT